MASQGPPRGCEQARPPDKDGVAYRWDAKTRAWVATGEGASARVGGPSNDDEWEPPLAVSAVAEVTAVETSSMSRM
jgi:hypothetical protein